MKHFMIWPILLPAIGLAHNEASCAASSSAQSIEHMVLAAGSWNTSDFDDFLQQPAPSQSITVEGTITEYGSDDLYDNKSDDAE